MEEYNYDEAAETINIEEITSDETNREILRRLKSNDPELKVLWVIDCRMDGCSAFTVPRVLVTWHC